MRHCRVAVIGAGIGGLTAALRLAIAGHEVTLFERQPKTGGKIRQLAAGASCLDAGPTVFTMRWVFEELFREAGTSLDSQLTTTPLSCLARHAWSETERLDLFADIERTADAIGVFAGPREAAGYRAFCDRARSVYRTLERPFIRSSQPTPMSLSLSGGLMGLSDMWRINPFQSLWAALGDFFQDVRLRQLFGRYATYCGSSPFLSPATLMLIAHVEQEGVWTIEGGMYRLVEVMTALAEAKGVTVRTGAEVAAIETASSAISGVRLRSGERVPADAVVVNADANAVASGLFGTEASLAAGGTLPSARSLSAVTWTLQARTSGFPLSHHNVFFSRDYAREFDDILDRGEIPGEPTVYICAEDRDGRGDGAALESERLFLLVNAPAIGDRRPFPQWEIDRCKERMLAVLARSGLKLEIDEATVTTTTPAEFAGLFPATGGALYGQASHGWAVSFTRPEARTRIPGLYLAGGSVHPGAGVPMAAISGWLAAESLKADLDSRARWSPVVMPGGMSMP